MIGINQNMKWDSLIPTDWVVDVNSRLRFEIYGHGDLSIGFIHNGTNTGKFNGWTFASLTEAEISAIQAGTTTLALPAGSFPFLGKVLAPSLITDAIGTTLKFNKNSICNPAYVYGSANDATLNALYSSMLASAPANNGKLTVSETSIPTGKNNITHLVYISSTGVGSIATGALTINCDQFAAFTVGAAGSMADITMSDTAITLSKVILLGDTTETTFSLSFNTNVEVQQID